MAARDLLVRVLGDTRDVEAAFARSSRAAATFGASVDTTGKKADRAAKNLKGFATGAAAGFGGAIVLNEVTQQLRASIDVASNLAEQISKTNVVFGKSADEVKAWSEKTASSIGIASDQALAAASTFGAMFDQAGRSENDAARLSESVVELAADLASFNNTSVDDALTALRSGLSGEIEPLRRFQVFLTEASVAAEAMAKSGKKSAKELSQGEKIMARWSLILQQTTKQQGDFARTSEGLANQQRILSAQVRDLQANLGTLLLPALTNITGELTDGAAAAIALADALRALGQVKIPPIEIPMLLDFGGTDLASVFGKAKSAALAGFETQFPGLKFVNDIVDLIKKQPEPNTRAAADAFDDNFDTFIESLEKDVDKSVTRANTKLKAFGEAGFKPLESNELGETLKRQFDNVIDALDLKLDRAKVTASTADDLAVLDEIENAVRARIKSQGRTTDLLRQLFQVEQTRASIIEGVAQQQEATRQANIDKVLGGLQLSVDRAALTKGLNDDLRALIDLRGGLQKQIAAGGNVLQYQGQLVSVVGQIADKRAEIEAAAQQGLQARQFRALGLSASGSAIVPTIDNLQKQLRQLTQRLGDDITPKIKAQLKNVGKVLAGDFGKATEESRAAIRDLFQTIRSTFDKESKKDIVPPRRIQISDKILKALGFDQDAEVKAFRAAQGIAQKAPTFPTGVKPALGTTTTTGGVTITGPVTVVADDPDAFLRELQKKASRTTATARGRFPGRSLGLG